MEEDKYKPEYAYFKRWGFGIGKLHVCWWDCWEKKLVFEISWYD